MMQRYSPCEKHRRDSFHRRSGILSIRLVALLAVLGIAVGIRHWLKTREESLKAIPDHFQQQKMNADNDWLKAAELLKREAAEQQAAVAAFENERFSSPEAGHFMISATPTDDRAIRTATVAFRGTEVALYKSGTTDAGSARDAGIAYLEHRTELQRERTEEGIQKNDELSAAAIAAGATDPLIRVYRIVDLIQSRGPSADELKELETQLELLEKSGRYPIAVFAGRRRLAQLAQDKWIDKPAERVAAAIAAVPAFVVRLTEDPLESRVKLEMLSGLYDRFSDSEKRKLVSTVVLTEGVDVWLRHQIAGRYYIQAAWEARSSAEASGVGPSQWKSFESLLDDASPSLKFAWFSQPDFPESCSLMVTLAMAGADRKPASFWFFEAVRAQPDFWDAYHRYLNAISPNWGGSESDVLEFGQLCLQTDRFDLGIPQFALVILETAEGRMRTARQRSPDEPEDVALVQQFSDLLNGLHDEMKNSVDTTGESLLKLTDSEMRGRLSRLLEEAGDYKRVTEILDAGGETDPQSKYDTHYLSGDARRSLLRAYAGEHQDDFRKLSEVTMQLLTEPDSIANTQGLTDEITRLRSLAKNDIGKAFLDFAERRVAVRKQFDEGAWVSLPISGPDADLWWYYASGYQPVSDETVEMRSRAFGSGVQMRLRMQFPMPYEVEAEVEHLEGRTERRGMGVLIGEHGGAIGTFNLPGAAAVLYSLSGTDNGENIQGVSVSVISEGSQGVPTAWMVRRLPGTRIGAMVWKEQFSPTLRGEVLLLRPETNSGWVPSSIVSFGEWYPNKDSEAAVVRVSSPRIRRLRFGPPPHPEASRDERVRYYESVVESMPENADAHHSLYFLLREHDPENGLQHLRKALELAPDITGLHGALALQALGAYDFTTGLNELEAEIRVEPKDYRLRAWLIRLLICHPDAALRDPARAQQIMESSDKTAGRFGTNKRYDLEFALPMLLAEQGKFDDALKMLASIEQRLTEEPLEYQLFQQQQASFVSGKPYRIDVEALKRLPTAAVDKAEQ